MAERAPGAAVLAGAGSASGVAAALELRRRGRAVVLIGRDEQALRTRYEAVSAPDGAGTLASQCALVQADLTDPSEAHRAAEEILTRFEATGVFHLVGGWRGGKGIVGQSGDDWRFLSANIQDSLHWVSQAFYEALLGAAAKGAQARLAIVSATGLDNPSASNANYLSAKAGAEAWMRSIAVGFAKAPERAAQNAAAVIFRVKALTWTESQARELGTAEAGPQVPGSTDVFALAEAFCNLFSEPAPALNGSVRAIA